jgi:uncharacterized protein (TIGR03083 family)
MGMSELAPAQRVMVGELLVDERRALLELLRGLGPEAWDRPTECPAWTVRGIALHLLGDDVSILSRQRDERPSRVAVAAAARGWDQLFVLLDQHNEAWVEATSDMSSRLLCELLQLTGEWTHSWYTTVDPDRLGEPVPWAGPEPAAYWFLAAREYLERWIHHQQIRRAVGADPLDQAQWVVPAVAVGARGFPAGLALLPAEPTTTITIALPGAGWTVRKQPDGWELLDGASEAPTVRLSLTLENAGLLFSRALRAAQIRERVDLQGDPELGSAIVAGLGAFFGSG